MRYFIIVIGLLLSLPAYAGEWKLRDTVSLTHQTNQISTCSGDCLLTATNQTFVAVGLAGIYDGIGFVNIGIEASVSDNPAILFLVNKKIGGFTMEANAGIMMTNTVYGFTDAGGNQSVSTNTINPVAGLTLAYNHFSLRYLVTSESNTINYNEIESFDSFGNPNYTPRSATIDATKTIWWIGYIIKI